MILTSNYTERREKWWNPKPKLNDIPDLHHHDIKLNCLKLRWWHDCDVVKRDVENPVCMGTEEISQQVCSHDSILSYPIHFWRMEYSLSLIKQYYIGFSWFTAHIRCKSINCKTSIRSELDPTILDRVNRPLRILVDCQFQNQFFQYFNFLFQYASKKAIVTYTCLNISKGGKCRN